MLHVSALIVVGERRNTHNPVYILRGYIFLTRLRYMSENPYTIADQLKSIGCEKFLVCFSWSTIKIFRKCCKNPLPTGASSREDLKFTHSLERYMYIRMYRLCDLAWANQTKCRR